MTAMAILLPVAVSVSPACFAATFSHTQDLIGEIRHYRVGTNESLIEIARRFDLGYNEIRDANPGVDSFVPKPGTVVTIPTAWIPPQAPKRPALVVNIPELRLYFFPEDPAGTVITFPLGIGDEGRDTPLGTFLVIEKIMNPSWHVPDSIRGESSGLPKVVPPGPENPLGRHAIRLSGGSILIHGTNRPWGIGRRSSHGCLRLYPEDIAKLFELVRSGMQVTIVDQPVKVGVKGNRVFLEVHRYVDEKRDVGETMHMLANLGLIGRIDFAKLIRAVEEQKGLPVEITRTE